jgi:hypothetical protein
MCFSYDYIKELHLEALSTFTEKFPPQTPWNPPSCYSTL